MNKLKEPVYLLGVGCSRFGSLLDTPEIMGLTPMELSAIAVREANEASPQQAAGYQGHGSSLIEQHQLL
jgi:hypothetical protein